MNIFDAWRAAEQRFLDGYGVEPDLSDRADLTVVVGLLGEILEDEDGKFASMFEDATERLTASTGDPLDRVLNSIAELRRELRGDS